MLVPLTLFAEMCMGIGMLYVHVHVCTMHVLCHLLCSQVMAVLY